MHAALHLTAAPTGNGVLRLWVDTWGEPSFAWEDLRWLAFVAGARTVANPVLVKPEAWAGELSVGGGGESALMVDWTPGDTTVRWSGPAGNVEKTYEVPPQSVMAWRERGETLVHVDFQGRIDLETGEITDTNTWR
ncbi:hypothetical protein M8Z33_13360 [Streptomyces sp. ZAF1911]|uniref:hypothetical protein n=1 Tax=Streptomyces sp. ZAF1911 TaxID=2944129 RepID=UPI00237B3C2A|nr:hypothetical protein [Streptomyces sp. ZAF1911]MDD9377628.1 hypothetical protein [Streptomyces sp. ZAF1911]